MEKEIEKAIRETLVIGNPQSINIAVKKILLLYNVSSSCSCGVPYVENKKSDISYDTEKNVFYTDILIHNCPKCGNIDRIDEY